MTQTRQAGEYTPPTITDYGRVGAVTLSNSVHFGVSLAQTFAASVVPQSGGGGNTGTLPGSETVVPGPGSTTGSAPGGAANPIVNHGGSGTSPGSVTSVPGSGSGGSGAGGATGGGKLPFTGMPALYLAGAGAALVSAGEAARRFSRRRSPDAS
jgi:hypothetical protein